MPPPSKRGTEKELLSWMRWRRSTRPISWIVTNALSYFYNEEADIQARVKEGR